MRRHADYATPLRDAMLLPPARQIMHYLPAVSRHVTLRFAGVTPLIRCLRTAIYCHILRLHILLRQFSLITPHALLATLATITLISDALRYDACLRYLRYACWRY